MCIVGASGKLGKYMIEHALHRGHEVAGVCREPSVAKLDAYRDRMKIVPGGAELIRVGESGTARAPTLASLQRRSASTARPPRPFQPPYRSPSKGSRTRRDRNRRIWRRTRRGPTPALPSPRACRSRRRLPCSARKGQLANRIDSAATAGRAAVPESAQTRTGFSVAEMPVEPQVQVPVIDRSVT